MNPFEALENIQEEYKSYVFSFQRFKNPIIENWVNEKVQEGTLLWRDPHLQLSRNFKKGDTLQDMIDEGLLHKEVLRIFRKETEDITSEPTHPYKHQSEAIKTILEKEKNTIVTASTGSGKSFCFGIPIINTCLEMKEKGIEGIKAIIVYPLNALANSQYENFAQRLHGTGLRIALYTGDTETSPVEALRKYKESTGREQPWDSEIISREEIQSNPPDILMTNYVMLDLIFSRFDDKSLFPPEHEGTLQYLVLDEIHTYTGQRGADVACLIRRVKQHTGTTGKIRCIGTSATVQAGEGEDSKEIVADFAQKLFGEPFERENVISETYEERTIQEGTIFSDEPHVNDEHIQNFQPTFESARELLEALTGEQTSHISTLPELGEMLSQVKTFNFIVNELENSSLSIEELTKKYRTEMRAEASLSDCKNEILAALLIGTVALRGEDPLIVPKTHTFFSQGKTISSCLAKGEPHLNGRGEKVCPVCAEERKKRKTFPLNFCRACGQEFYGATLLADGTLIPRDIDTEREEGESIYIYPGHHDEKDQSYPENWYQNEEKLKKKAEKSILVNAEYCPECNKVNPSDDECFGHQRVKVSIIRSPFLFCPSCGVYYDKGPREFNKLFTFGSVGRSTATDVLLSSILEQLPETQKKIIAFSDNRQDTALQAAHINNLQKRIHFRRGLYQTLLKYGTLIVTETGSKIFDAFDNAGVLPTYSKTKSKYIDTAPEKDAYQDYLLFNVLQDLRSTQHKNQLNLEDVGLMKVSYRGIKKLASDDELWSQIPEIGALPVGERQDLIQGFLDIFRKQQAIHHESIVKYSDFKYEKIKKLDPECLFHVARYRRRIAGYSDTADRRKRGIQVSRISYARSRLVSWIKKVLYVDMERTKEIVLKMVDLLAEEEAGYLVSHPVKRCGNLYMVPASMITLEVCEESQHKVCGRCGEVYHFEHLNMCSMSKCQELEEKDFSDNYFRKIYLTNFDEAVKIKAEEHSGQIKGDTRRNIEKEFKDIGSPLNTIICTPTMELGIDIGILSAIYMRNVPPSPSNYAQRSGRAGRERQPSLITTFCGAGARRGPHDQYFYKYPEKIISGSITPPRFMLDNKKLIRTHLHSLILEEADMRLPSKPEEILVTDIESGKFPMIEERKEEMKQKVEAARDTIIDAIRKAFSYELGKYHWFDEKLISDIVDNFVEELDSAFDYWRFEYENLLRERHHINIRSTKGRLERGERIRRDAIEEKLAAMREGEKDFYTYNYLRSQGFVPGYGFPTSYTTLSLSNTDDEIIRDKVIALNEFAPGNTLYFKNQKYSIRRARLRREEQIPLREPVLICPSCDSIFLGEPAVSLSACPECGESFETYHYNSNAMEFPDMYASRKERITSDEEERIRRGYNISHHYERGPRVKKYIVKADKSSFRIIYEHNGKIIAINRGTRKIEEDGQHSGFVFCNACNEWLSGSKIKSHVEGGCFRNATEDDIIQEIYLFTRDNHDVVTLDIPVPDTVLPDQKEAFYLSVKEAILQGIQISLNVEENEVKGMIKPNPKEEDIYKIIIFEKAEGGTGVIKALTDEHRLKDVFTRAREILHEGEEGCKKACYECLLSYYNQMEHELLDRHLALTFLDKYRSFKIELEPDGDNLGELKKKCDSDFERVVLDKIVESGLPVPDKAQKILYDKKGVPIAKPDFFYDPNIAVFVDGPVHEKEYMKEEDKKKRDKLRALGYTVISIKDVSQVIDLRKYLV
jgi:superfamily II DNA/RNA helicase/ribosomal protein L37AE/L43A